MECFFRGFLPIIGSQIMTHSEEIWYSSNFWTLVTSGDLYNYLSEKCKRFRMYSLRAIEQFFPRLPIPLRFWVRLFSPIHHGKVDPHLVVVKVKFDTCRLDLLDLDLRSNFDNVFKSISICFDASQCEEYNGQKIISRSLLVQKLFVKTIFFFAKATVLIGLHHLMSE